MRVSVLGSTGMVGSMVYDYLSQQEDIELISEWSQCDWIINCIGLINKNIDESKKDSVEQAIRVNALFPYRLTSVLTGSHCQILQPATDCVFKGDKGGYRESSLHDAADIYGKTKSLGEVNAENIHHLRCSMIGPELKGRLQLMDKMVRRNKLDAVISGYPNHDWNGITTLHFAKICYGVIKNGYQLGYIQHVVPRDKTDKDALLGMLIVSLQRKDIKLKSVKTEKIDRSLDTDHHDVNTELWKMAGYNSPPCILDMVQELAEYIREGKTWA